MIWPENRIYPESWQEGDSWRFIWMVTRGGLAAVFIFLFYLFQRDWVEMPLRSRLLATSIFASAFLTFLLIAVYRDLSDIQDDQSVIMERQEELMELEYRPTLWVENIGFVDDERMSIMIHNAGNNLAKGLHIIVHGKAEIGNDEISLDEAEVIDSGEEIASFRPSPSPFTSIEGGDVGRFTHIEGDVLDGKEKGNFVCSPMFMGSNEPRDKGARSWSGISLPKTVRRLDDLGIEKVTLQFSIVYRGLNDQIYAKILGTLSLSFSPIEYPDEFDDFPEMFEGIIPTGGSPDSGEWTLSEIFERGSYQPGVFMAMVDENDIIQELDDGIGFFDRTVSYNGD